MWPGANTASRPRRPRKSVVPELSSAAAKFLLLVADDLMVASRVEGVARHLGFSLRQARSPEQFWQSVDEGPALVLLSTQHTRLDWESLLRELGQKPDPPPVLAFGPHMDADQRGRARAAGVTKWVPNSRMATDLPDLIGELIPDS